MKSIWKNYREWEDYQIEELKNNNRITTKEHKQECKEYLFNKYKKQIEEQPKQTIQIISKLRKSSDYKFLTVEEQERLYLDLTNPNKRSDN